jgi:hypothetical protein
MMPAGYPPAPRRAMDFLAATTRQICLRGLPPPPILRPQGVPLGKKATMALINFDCPECGHNLEVDEGGAGFIVKCPECANPLQIPGLPKSHRIRKWIAVAGRHAPGHRAALRRQSLPLVPRAQNPGAEVAELAAAGRSPPAGPGLSMEQDAEIARLKSRPGRSEAPRARRPPMPRSTPSRKPSPSPANWRKPPATCSKTAGERPRCCAPT